MAINLEELVLRLEAKGGAGAARDVDNARRSVVNLNNASVKLFSHFRAAAGSGLGGLGRGVAQAFGMGSVFSAAGLTAAGVGLVGFAVKSAMSFESLKMGLQSVAGSAEETERQLMRLREVAKAPGLGFREAVQGSIRLQAAGINATLAERALTAFGSSLARSGAGKEELEGTIRALSQIQSKGMVFAEEISQIAERVPDIRKAMLAAFGTSNTEAIQKMGVTSEKFIEKLVGGLEKIPGVLGGTRNSWDNAMDAMDQGAILVGSTLNRQLKGPLESLVSTFDKLGKNGTFERIGTILTQIVAPAIGAFERALKNIQTMGFEKWLGGIIKGVFYMAGAIAVAVGLIALLTKNYFVAVTALIAAFTLPIVGMNIGNSIANLKGPSPGMGDLRQNEQNSMNAALNAMGGGNASDKGNEGLPFMQDSTGQEIARNTREMADQFRTLKAQMFGGGRRTSGAMSAIEAELALARALGQGIG